MTTWAKVGVVLLEAAGNPYVLVLVIISIWNAVNDPTTAGLTDSFKALKYDKPNNEK